MPALEAMTVGRAGRRGRPRRAARSRRRRAGRSVRAGRRRGAGGALREMLDGRRDARADARRRLGRRAEQFTWARHGAVRCARPGRWRARRAGRAVADRPLHIGVDGRELVGQADGRRPLSVVGAPAAWAADPASPHRFTIFLPAPPPACCRRRSARAVGGASSRRRARGTLWEQTRLPRALAAVASGRVLSPPATRRRCACPVRSSSRSTTCRSSRTRSGFGRREGLRRRWLTRAAARRARRDRHDLASSRADEIVRYLDVPRERIVVAPPGAPARASRRTTGCARARRPVRRLPVQSAAHSGAHRRRSRSRSRARFRTPGWCSSATTARRRASIRARSRPSSAIGDRVDWREYVHDAELDDALPSARACSRFCRTTKASRMTPIEALAHGVPSVLLDTPVAREVYGDAARCSSPRDPAAIADALDDAADRRRGARARCSRGRAPAAGGVLVGATAADRPRARSNRRPRDVTRPTSTSSSSATTRATDLGACLASLARPAGRALCGEIVVVDNASTDGSVDAGARDAGRESEVIALDRNVGFGAANNVGVRADRRAARPAAQQRHDRARRRDRPAGRSG